MITVLIVIYNKKCNESLSFNFIEKYKKQLNLIVFDNSTGDYGNSKYCNENDILYYSVGENVGLSKAYNYVINKMNLNCNDYLLLLDDDTILNDSYIDEVLIRAKSKEADIYLPIVYSNNYIISPSKVVFDCRVKRINNKDDIDKLNDCQITGINSGMMINLKVFKSIKYNEDLFLDYVDHEFLKRAKQYNFSIKMLESSINQNFSRHEKAPLVNAIFRNNIYKKDFKEYCRICNRKWFYYINVFKLKIVNFIKYKKLF